ncbi:MAG: WD40 repeat domain-containing protein, partial [Capsulimonadaceae bacterium]
MAYIVRWALLTILLLAPAVEYRAVADADDAPQIQIETGEHSSRVNDVCTDAKQRYLVSCSNDKSVRVWDAGTGDLLNILRPPIPAPCAGLYPIEASYAGILYSVAITPDGQRIACCGITGGTPQGGYTIYIFDRTSGQIVSLIGGLRQRAYKLAYSPDGQYLAAGTGAGSGLLLYNTTDYTLVAQDKDYDEKVFGLAFATSRSGLRLASASEDHAVRLYAVTSGSTTLLTLDQRYNVARQHPCTVAFSPDASHLAVGFAGDMRVLVLTCNSDITRFTGFEDAAGGGSTEAVPGADLGSVAWFADGRTLAAAGRYRTTVAGRKGYVVRRWQNYGQSAPVDTPVAGDGIYGLASRQDGGVYWGAADATVGAMAADGQIVFETGAPAADLKGQQSWRISDDGRHVAFSYGASDTVKTGHEFSIADNGCSLGIGDSSAMAGPRTSSATIQVGGIPSGTTTLNGGTLPIVKRAVSKFVAIAPDNHSIVLSASWHLYRFSDVGSQIWRTPIDADACGVNISGDGRIAVAKLTDGTIHWYRMTDGQELLTLFPHADRKRWVAWTPAGYFDCSPGAEDLIGWHVNRGPDQAADFLPATRFRDTHYRPDVV